MQKNDKNHQIVFHNTFKNAIVLITDINNVGTKNNSTPVSKDENYTNKNTRNQRGDLLPNRDIKSCKKDS